MGWVDGPVVGFDTETTGVDVTRDRIVSAAVVRRAGRSTSVRSWLVDPGVEVPDEAAAIHGLTTGHLRHHGRSPAGALDEIADALVAALLRGEPLVAFNASFDLSILDAELARHGLPTLARRLARDVRVVLDPLVLDRGLDRFRPGRRRLGTLCAYYRVADVGPLHRAEADVLAAFGVLDALVARFGFLADLGLDELHDRQAFAHGLWLDGFNRRRSADGMALAEPGWPLRRPRAGRHDAVVV